MACELVDLGRRPRMSYGELLKVAFEAVNPRFNGRDPFVLWNVAAVGYRQKVADYRVGAYTRGPPVHDGFPNRSADQYIIGPSLNHFGEDRPCFEIGKRHGNSQNWER